MFKDVKVLRPIGFKAFQFYKEFKSASEDSTKLWEKLFKFTQSTWRVRTGWHRNIAVGAQEVVFETFTKDKIYYFLNFGTKKRYAVMPRGWISKTAPGRFFPNQGAGFFDRNAPGAFDWREWAASARAIDARGWDIQVKKKTEKAVVNRFRLAMQKGVINSGHKHGK